MFAALLALGFPQADAGILFGKWSKPVDGLRARLRLEPEVAWKTMRRVDVRIEIENVGDIANPMVIQFDPTKTLRPKMVDSKGHPMFDSWGAIDMITPSPHPLTVPYKGQITLYASAQGHYGMPDRKGARMIEMVDGVWIVDDGATASLSCTLTAPEPKGGGTTQWHGALTLPPVTIPASFPKRD